MMMKKVYMLGVAYFSLGAAFGLCASDQRGHVVPLPCLERAMHIIEINQNSIIITAHCALPHFHHQTIIDCYCAMRDTQSVTPLFGLWHQIRELEFIDDPLITSDFIRFVIILCRAQLQTQLFAKTDTLEQMFALYDQIASLPIPQLLNLLDDIVNQYESFHQQFELNNQSLTWSEWFKKYWWAPPIVVVSVFITYLRHSTWMTAQG